jgi:hypothetical protein
MRSSSVPHPSFTGRWSAEFRILFFTVVDLNCAKIIQFKLVNIDYWLGCVLIAFVLHVSCPVQPLEYSLFDLQLSNQTILFLFYQIACVALALEAFV